MDERVRHGTHGTPHCSPMMDKPRQKDATCQLKLVVGLMRVRLPNMAMLLASRHPPLHCLDPFQHDSSLSLAQKHTLYHYSPPTLQCLPSSHRPRVTPHSTPNSSLKIPRTRSVPCPLFCPLFSQDPQHTIHSRAFFSPPRLLSPIGLHDQPYLALVCPPRFPCTPALTCHPTELQVTHPMWSSPQEARPVSSPCSLNQAPSSSATHRLSFRCLWTPVHIRSTPMDLCP